MWQFPAFRICLGKEFHSLTVLLEKVPFCCCFQPVTWWFHFFSPTSCITRNQSNHFLIIFSVTLSFLFICVISTLGCLFSVHKILNLVISCSEAILYYVIPLSAIWSHPTTTLLIRKPGLQAVFSCGQTIGLYKGIIMFSDLFRVSVLVIPTIPLVFSQANWWFHRTCCSDWEFLF